MSFGKTRTLSNIKKNADPRVEFVDVLAAGAGTAGMRNTKAVRRNGNLRIDIKVVHIEKYRVLNLGFDAVSFAVHCFDNLSRVAELFTHRRNMHIHDTLVRALVHRSQLEAQLLA